MSKRLKKGILVKVLVGKDRGKEGLIKVLYPTKQTVVVEGINMAKKHAKPTRDSVGEIRDIELPIHESNVRVVLAEKVNKK